MMTSIGYRSGGWINIKMSSYQYRKFHCGDQTILRPSYLHNGISYTDKMTSLYWIRAQIVNSLKTLYTSPVGTEFENILCEYYGENQSGLKRFDKGPIILRLHDWALRHGISNYWHLLSLFNSLCRWQQWRHLSSPLMALCEGNPHGSHWWIRLTKGQ